MRLLFKVASSLLAGRIADALAVMLARYVSTGAKHALVRKGHDVSHHIIRVPERL